LTQADGRILIILFSNTPFGLVALAATTATAQGGLKLFVTVGAGRKLEFSPNNITSTAGNQIEFTFNQQACNL
jgi:plastocyanin